MAAASSSTIGEVFFPKSNNLVCSGCNNPPVGDTPVVIAKCQHVVCFSCYANHTTHLSTPLKERTKRANVMSTSVTTTIVTASTFFSPCPGVCPASDCGKKMHAPVAIFKMTSPHSPITNVRKFALSPWNASPEDFDAAWLHDRESCNKALDQLYEMLRIFFTDKGMIMRKESLKIALSAYNRLSILAARPQIAEEEWGNDIGKLCYGYCLVWGIGVQQDKMKGEFFLLQAAEKKNSLAYYHLGRFYKKEKRHENALLSFSQGADLEESSVYPNCFDCQVELARCYLEKESEKEKNISNALKLLMPAIEAKHVYALTLLGDFYKKEEKFVLAYRCYRQAFRRGNKDVEQELKECKVKMGAFRKIKAWTW